MYGRWGTFAIGIGLILAPVVIGYPEVTSILHDVAMGLLACVLSLAALETPALRYLSFLPAGWLIWTGHRAAHAGVSRVELLAGALLVAASLLPRAVPRLDGAGRARDGARA
jgi:hypothetical protein